MAPNLIKFIGFGDIYGPKTYKFIGFGEPSIDNFTQGVNRRFVTNGSGLLGEWFGSFVYRRIFLRDKKQNL